MSATQEQNRSHGSRLGSEDAARLHMSVAGNPMLITVLLLLDRPIPHEVLEARLERCLKRHPRFRQRVVEPRFGLGMPRWIDDPTFDVRHHVHRLDTTLLPRPATLDELVSRFASMPLGQRHPLWRLHLVDDPHQPAVVMIIHHALADGSALLSLLAELADERTASTPPPSSSPARGHRSRVWQIAAGAAAAGKLALHRADPITALNRAHPTGQKHLAYSTDVPLATLRHIAHALDTTVTGVLLLAVTGALRAELGDVEAKEAPLLHALVPVDTRAGAPASAMGNRFGSVLVPLPVGTADLEGRVAGVREATRSLGSRASGIAATRVAAAAGAVSAIVERIGVEVFSRKASAVVSSVRGPTSAVHICGAFVRDVVVWAPAPGNIGVSVTLMSYANRARIAAAVDAHVVDDARRIVHELEQELEGLLSAASAT
jgi:diacylglycerol O-acyltransferase